MTRDEAVFEEISVEWRGLQGHTRAVIGAWENRLDSLISEEARLRGAGKWVHGRSDYLGVIGKHRDELAHSKMLAWLLDPCAKHGLGTRVLDGLLRETHPELPPPSRLESATVLTEVVLKEGRLDIVIDLPDCYLVIENKVDAQVCACLSGRAVLSQ